MILLEVNEYQDFDGLQLSYDDNGNLLEDDQFLFTYDAMNRITQVNRKSDNALVATYKYDFMNRRISKEFTRTESGGNGGGNNGGGNGVGEYSTDADTVALYHYNETSGSVIDSSGNNNHGKAPRSTKRGVEGLFDTTAIKFKGAPILVRKSDSLDSIEDTLTLETFVYLDAKKWKFSRGGSLIHRLGAYQLEIERKTRKASFSIVTKEIADENRRYKKHKHKHKHYNHNRPKKQFATIYSNESIPLNQWVHIAAVYDGEKITIYINCTKQTEEKEIDGDIHDCQTPLFLGGIGFFGTMEETRISKTTRSEFNCNPTDDGNNDPGDDNSETTNIQIKRKFFYNGWRVIEEHEQQAETGQEFSNEVVSRQYVDGLGIDEHLQMLTFDAEGANIESEVYFHENARGDTIALTNANGETVLQLEYTTYGEVFAIDDNGQILELDDIALVVYTFQGRRSDEETGLMYFRNRYYNQELGRWLQRDPLGYVDSYGLYEAFGGNPYGYGDALGGYTVFIQVVPEKEYKSYKKIYNSKEKRFKGINHIAYSYKDDYIVTNDNTKTQINKNEIAKKILKNILDAADRAKELNEPLDLVINAHNNTTYRGGRGLKVMQRVFKLLNDSKKVFNNIADVEIRSIFFLTCWGSRNQLDQQYFNYTGAKYLILSGKDEKVRPSSRELDRITLINPFHEISTLSIFSDALDEKPEFVYSDFSRDMEGPDYIAKVSYFEFIKELNNLEEGKNTNIKK